VHLWDVAIRQPATSWIALLSDRREPRAGIFVT
jgi:hypothetical protein